MCTSSEALFSLGGIRSEVQDKLVRTVRLYNAAHESDGTAQGFERVLPLRRSEMRGVL